MDIRMKTWEEETKEYTQEAPKHIDFLADPDDVIRALASGATMTGKPVEVAGYPVGTWFYYGTEQVGVRFPGEGMIARLEKR